MYSNRIILLLVKGKTRAQEILTRTMHFTIVKSAAYPMLYLTYKNKTQNKSNVIMKLH